MAEDVNNDVDKSSPRGMTLQEKLVFFGKKYFSSENYGVKGGYEAYDKDGFWETTLKTIREYFHENTEGISYLDLGCAFGHLLKRVPFKNCHGGDISWEALRQTQKAIKERGREGYTNIIQLDADCQLPYGNESFDCVTALDVVEHTLNPKKTVSEIARVMKNDGLCIIGTPITDTLEGQVWGPVFDKDKSHFSKPTREGLFQALEEAGFEVLDFRYYFPLPGQKIPFPRTNMEVAARKTTRSAEDLRKHHQIKFKSASFLKATLPNTI